MLLKRESKSKRQGNGKPRVNPQQKKPDEIGNPESRKSTMQTRRAPAKERTRR